MRFLFCNESFEVGFTWTITSGHYEGIPPQSLFEAVFTFTIISGFMLSGVVPLGNIQGCVHWYQFFKLSWGSTTGKHAKLCSGVPMFQVIMGEYHWETCKAVFRGTTVSCYHGGYHWGTYKAVFRGTNVSGYHGEYH